MPTAIILRRRLAHASLAAFAILALATTGCPTVPQTGGGTDDGGSGGGDGTVSARVVNITSNIRLSRLDPAVSVTYAVTGTPTSISGFFVKVADAGAIVLDDDDRVIIATNLPTSGNNTRFSFDPTASGAGFFRVGVLLINGGTETEAFSAGTIQVEGPPAPFFIQPFDATTSITPGQSVFISFDAGDSDSQPDQIHWRLCFVSETDSRALSADSLGTQIAIGTGNIGSATLQTATIAPGNYTLCLSATDSGSSIASTVSSGRSDRIVTVFGPTVRIIDPSAILPPTLTFSQPGSSDVSLFRNQAFLLEFSTVLVEIGATATIELFYDDDKNVGNGFRDTLAGGGNLPSTRTTFPLPTDLPEGTWTIGATVRTVGGISSPVTFYAGGRINVVRNPTLTITEPGSLLPVSPGAKVNIAWTTDAPVGSGDVEVFAQRLGSGGGAGTPIQILPKEPISATTTATFSNETPGQYQIFVKLTFVDGTTLEKSAPQIVRVSSLPPILWVGSIASADPPFEGAIFGGVNFEDNAGASLSTAGDLNGDGRDEIVIGARYGKPFFQNPSGVGPGEAYVVFGGAGSRKLKGEFSLNSVGTETLPGVILTGVRTVNDSNDTDGLVTIALLPDVDGDQNGELAFGFPRTNSAALFPNIINPDVGGLEIEGQFLSGGVVILSSTNSALRGVGNTSRVINLDVVGRQFSDVTVTPNDPALVLADRRQFQPADATVDPPTLAGCFPGTDNVMDTIIGPSVGFISPLAPPLWVQQDFDFLAGAPFEDNCPTEFDLVDCAGGDNPLVRAEVGGQGLQFFFEGGSGFYPLTATPLEPIGARIIGIGNGDRFGSSITVSKLGGPADPGDLVITAPSRDGFNDLVPELANDVTGAGVAFITNNRNLWGPDNVFLNGEPPPTPHQYMVGFRSHCGDSRAESLGAARMVGSNNDRIQTVLGLSDFNGDGISDIAIGAPAAGGGGGQVYIALRRGAGSALEGNFVLSKLKADPNDPERLDGLLLVTSGAPDALGSSLATGFDFNGDGVEDLVIGAPNAKTGRGEVIIVFGVFGNSPLTSPANGLPIADLLSARLTADGQPVAARITGNSLDPSGRFGFNVANAGDLDGDGLDDLLIAAPGATPRFDPDPTDTDDVLTEVGLDLDFDGVKDELIATSGLPLACVGADNELQSAGLVYVIFGKNRLDNLRTCSVSGKVCEVDADCDAAGETCGTTTSTINIDQLGTAQLKGMIIVGRCGGDRLGGGDAGDTTLGGISAKAGRGRSAGLASAGDVDGDGRDDILIGSVLADPRRDVNTGVGVRNGGEVYLIYGSVVR